MKKLLSIIFFSFLCQQVNAASLVSVSNNMMTSTGEFGSLSLGTFDPFNPEINCNTFSAPNTCTANGRDPVNISLVFNYNVSLDALTGSSIDLFFTVNNGLGGATGEFINVVPPSNIFFLQDGSVGSFDLSFDIPLFGPQSRYEYGLDLEIQVTINP
jgi:hypothetical protein